MTDARSHAMFSHLCGMLEAINDKLDAVQGELLWQRNALMTLDRRVGALEASVAQQTPQVYADDHGAQQAR